MTQHPFDSGLGPRDAKAQARADKAYAKAMRPWYKKKRFIIPGALVGLVVVGGGLGGGVEDTATTTPQTVAAAVPADPAAGEVQAAAPAPAEPEAPAFTPVYSGQLETDLLAQPGQPTQVSDWTVTVTPLERKTAEYLDGEYLCTDVTMVNNSAETQDYNAGSFRLQDPNGGIQDYGTYYPDAESIGYGSAAPGGKVSGTECFEGRDKGQYILFYQPNIYTGDGGRAAFVMES